MFRSRLVTQADYDQLPKIVEQYPVTWVNVDGLGDADVVARIGKIFGLHPLALEDTLNNHQRSKVEQYGDHLFIVARVIESGAGWKATRWRCFSANDSSSRFSNCRAIASTRSANGFVATAALCALRA